MSAHVQKLIAIVEDHNSVASKFKMEQRGVTGLLWERVCVTWREGRVMSTGVLADSGPHMAHVCLECAMCTSMYL
jgi:hypothetical protein